jgi:putative ABC transport system ATP-binding protein
MIKTKNLSKIFTTGEVATIALNHVNMEMQDGEFVAVMGPSGCGKSTLLHIAGMLDNPTGGEYYFMGEEVSRYPEKKRAKLRKGNIGFVFQSFNLIDELTVFENIELPLLYLGISAAKRKKRVDDMLEKLGLIPRKNHFPQQISGGQQQRVAVARAVICQPKIILADEPTGNLDSRHGDEVMKILVDLNEQGTTIIMVTHSPGYADYASRIIHLFDGHVVSENLKEMKDLHTRTVSSIQY